MRLRFIYSLLVITVCVFSVAAEESFRVPIFLNKPDRLNTPSWPVTFGIPFKQGEIREAEPLCVVDEKGEPVPCQIVKTGDWTDGSMRWIAADFRAEFDKKYFLTRGGRPDAKDDIQTHQSDSAIIVETGGARYAFTKGAGCFDSIALDVNSDGTIAADETLVSNAGSAFYVVDSKDRRGMLRGKKLSVEVAGKRHAVIRIEGDYVTDDGKTNAAGVVYFYFYAGLPWTRVSHKLIVAENTNELWFKDIGVTLPVALHGVPLVTFNNDHAKSQSAIPVQLRPAQEVLMMQDEFPHFASTNSHYAISTGGTPADRASTAKEIQSGGACGDWVDVSSKRCGLAAQVPGFAEQFPKAFRVSPTHLTIKLWASESGKELDFRTPQIIKNYFGHDWIPEDDPCVKLPNTAQGTAKIHEIWLYPHAGPLTPAVSAQFGATRDEIYACIDPAWVARSEVMGPFHSRDTKRFPKAEEVISDYFDRSVLAGNKIFPAQGYLYWGMYPYSCQPWKIKNGRWYPTIHRLARSLEYNLKRGMWILYARSGERKYYDYARRYTRLCGNLLFSNHDTPGKPLGWMMQGPFHSPIVWGHFGEAKPGHRPKMDGGNACIAVASSEDVVQFVYDYFLTGDLHSRDMAWTWKEAMIAEMQFDVDKALQFYPPEAFLRVLGSAYELDHDPRLLDYGSKIVKRRVLCDGKQILNPDVPTNFGKEGEVFSAYYYYHVATGDPLAQKALVELAKFRYQHGQLDYFFSRSSALQEAFVFAARDTGDETYGAYAAQVANDYVENYQTLNDMGVDVEKLNQSTTSEWGRVTMVGQGPINIGIPTALRVAAESNSPQTFLPYAIKQYPTQRTHLLLKKEKAGPASIEVFVNNWGERAIEPKLLDAQGKPAKLDVVERVYDRIDKPQCHDAHSIWYLMYEDQLFYKLRISESVPPGMYELDLGSEIEFTVLRSDLDRILQVAPQGTVLTAGRRYYFPLPKNAEAIEYFSSRPVRLFDPDGTPVTPEHIADAHFRFQTGGKTGAWGIEGGSDEFIGSKKASVDTFVKIERVVFTTSASVGAAKQYASTQPAVLSPPRGAKDKAEGGLEISYPLVLALGDPKRLFDVDVARFTTSPVDVSPTADNGNPYVESRTGFGKTARLSSRFAEVAGVGESTGQEFPHRRGTVEFWMRPMWSASDCHLIGSTIGSTIRVELYKAAPISIRYHIDPDNGGRVGRYNTAYLGATIEGIGSTRCGVYLEAGKWYHIAVTWNVDGQNNDAHIFINGRKKGFCHYDNTLPAKKDPATLSPPAKTIRFGSAHSHGPIATSEDFDELRISRTIRYEKDFEPPTAPFEKDADTYLLMHLDGSEEALVAGKTLPVKWVRGKKM